MILDADVFILAERNPARLAALLERLNDEVLRTNEGVMGQVWRKPAEQVRLSRFLDLADVEVEPLEDGEAIGVLLARADPTDVVDASVALMAIADRDVVLTGDAQILAALGAVAVALPS